MNKLALIGGAPRSGTTMLDLMLGNSSDSFSCGEVYAKYRPWRKHHFHPKCACSLDPCPVWEKFNGVDEKQFHAKAFQLLNVNLISDSSKQLHWIYDSQLWANEDNYNVFNLVLFKDPIDYAWSFWKRGRGIETWRDVYKDYYKKYLSLDMPMLSVSYSELINDPEIKLRDIFNALDIHYSKGREKFWMNKSHHLFGNQMTTQQVEKHESYGLIKPDYDEKFIVQFENKRMGLENDKDLNYCLKNLQSIEVSKLKNYPGSTTCKLSKIKPMWYCSAKVRISMKKIFPDEI